MKKQIIFAILIAFAATSCKNNENKTAEDKDQPATTQQTTATAEEPVLKYGHVFSGDCSATSIDWPGNYVGATGNKGDNPARLRLTLNKDWTYELKIMALEYLKNGDIKETLQSEVKGTFTFDSAGQIIKLLGSNHPLTNEQIAVSVEENRLSVLGADLKELKKDGDLNTLYK